MIPSQNLRALLINEKIRLICKKDVNLLFFSSSSKNMEDFDSDRLLSLVLFQCRLVHLPVSARANEIIRFVVYQFVSLNYEIPYKCLELILETGTHFRVKLNTCSSSASSELVIGHGSGHDFKLYTKNVITIIVLILHIPMGHSCRLLVYKPLLETLASRRDSNRCTYTKGYCSVAELGTLLVPREVWHPFQMNSIFR